MVWTTVGCFTPDDCPESEDCYSGQCVNPCRPGSNPCPSSATCHALSHSAICMCPPGYTGVPLQGCSLLPACGFNSDCPKDKACIDRVCHDPCKDISCPVGSLCQVESHRPVCLCPKGYRGNPETGCVRSDCESDEQCSSGHSCRSGVCEDPCQDCGRGALCRLEARAPVCYCPIGFIGNPKLACDPSKTIFTFFCCLYIQYCKCESSIHVVDAV